MNCKLSAYCKLSGCFKAHSSNCLVSFFFCHQIQLHKKFNLISKCNHMTVFDQACPLIGMYKEHTDSKHACSLVLGLPGAGHRKPRTFQYRDVNSKL